MNNAVYDNGLPYNITATGLVYTGPGCIQGIIVNSNTSGTIKLWDALTATTPVITNTFTFPAGSGSYIWYGAKFKTGLYATVGGTLDCTIVLQPYNG